MWQIGKEQSEVSRTDQKHIGSFGHVCDCLLDQMKPFWRSERTQHYNPESLGLLRIRDLQVRQTIVVAMPNHTGSERSDLWKQRLPSLACDVRGVDDSNVRLDKQFEEPRSHRLPVGNR